MLRKSLLISSFMSALLFSSESVNISSQEEELYMVITNSDSSLVVESRKFSLPLGRKRVKLTYDDVPSSMVTASLIPSFTDQYGAPSTKIYTQKYNRDTVSLDKLLTHSIGKNIQYKIYSSPEHYDFVIKYGELISINPTLVQEKGDGGIYAIPNDSILFEKIPDFLSLKPNITWDVESSGGEQSISLAYLTQGLQWSADYTLLYDEETESTNIMSFITIKNNSGKSFSDVKLKCLAGDIRKNQHPKTPLMRSMAMDDTVFENNFENNAISGREFSGYHLYSVPYKVDLNNNETTQIQFINKNIISSKKLKYSGDFPIRINKPSQGSDSKISFDQSLNFSTGDLDAVLPAGEVRMYQNDNKEIVYIGENRIENTPKNTDVSLSFGKSFDVSGHTELLPANSYEYNEKIFINGAESSVRRNFSEGLFQVTLKNDSSKPKEVNLDFYLNGEVHEASFSSKNCVNECTLTTSKKKISLNAVLDANSEKNIETSYRIIW